jgi:RNA-binding protein YhbY
MADEHYRDCSDLPLCGAGRSSWRRILGALAHELRENFSIGHATIQVEVDEEIACTLEADHVV